MKRALLLVVLSYVAVTSVMAQERVKAVSKQRALGAFDYDWHGSVSSDGRFLTFVDWDTGDLALRDLKTGANRHLTKKGSWFESDEFALFSTMSPDSKQVAYTWFDKGGPSLRLVGLDGSGQRVLHHDEAIASYEPRDWTPDGKWVLATLIGKDGTNQIVLVSVANGSIRVLQNLVDLRSPLRMKFSPDGRYIAYDFPPRKDSTDWQIFVLSADGRHKAPLVEHPAKNLLIGWTPDGKRILIASDRMGTVDAWLVQVAEGKPQGLPELVKRDLGSWFFPLGFTREGSFYYGVMTEMDELYFATLNPVTGKLQSPPTLVSHVGGWSSADWSPDGQQLAYVLRRVL